MQGRLQAAMASSASCAACSTSGRGEGLPQQSPRHAWTFAKRRTYAFKSEKHIQFRASREHLRLSQCHLRASSGKHTHNTLHATPADNEEAQLTADYGALSERLESLAEEVSELLQGTSIYLVGMMGSGKSTVGRLVGKALKYPLLDTDALIEKSTRSTVSELFAEEGEDAFRDLETDVLQQLMPFAKCIVATGGGAVIRRQNWGYMQHGVVIWLDGTPELLASHVVGQSGGIKSRPLIFSNNQPVAEEARKETQDTDEYSQTVTKLANILEERKGKYGFADIRVSLQSGEHGTLGAEAVVVAYRVLTALKKRLVDSATEKKNRQNFTIEGADDVPKSLKVKQAKQNGNGKA